MLDLPLAALAICALVVIAQFTVDHYKRLAPANISVGHATFYGLLMGANRVAILAAFWVGAGLGTLGWVLTRYIRRVSWLNHLTAEKQVAKPSRFLVGPGYVHAPW